MRATARADACAGRQCRAPFAKPLEKVRFKGIIQGPCIRINVRLPLQSLTPGNANLPIGDGTEAQNANREIGVPRARQPTPERKFKIRTLSKRADISRATDTKMHNP